MGLLLCSVYHEKYMLISVNVFHFDADNGRLIFVPFETTFQYLWIDSGGNVSVDLVTNGHTNGFLYCPTSVWVTCLTHVAQITVCFHVYTRQVGYSSWISLCFSSAHVHVLVMTASTETRRLSPSWSKISGKGDLAVADEASVERPACIYSM